MADREAGPPCRAPKLRDQHTLPPQPPTAGWVFWFNVPFALAGCAWAAAILHETSGRSEDRQFDFAGTITFLIGLTGLVLGISKGGISGWTSPVVIGGLIAAAVLLPAFVLIERHHRAPMLDLSIFSSRLFSAAAAAAFINGLARFALMFVFVFYFQACRGILRSWPESSSRRWRWGCWCPRRWRGSGPTAAARAGWPCWEWW